MCENLSNLHILRLHHNKISNVQKLGLANIQIIDLNSNQVESLQFGQFAGLANLRIVDLSLNRLRSLPRDAFQVTSPKNLFRTTSLRSFRSPSRELIGNVDLPLCPFFALKRNYAGWASYNNSLIHYSYSYNNHNSIEVFPPTKTNCTFTRMGQS